MNSISSVSSSISFAGAGLLAAICFFNLLNLFISSKRIFFFSRFVIPFDDTIVSRCKKTELNTFIAFGCARAFFFLIYLAIRTRSLRNIRMILSSLYSMSSLFVSSINFVMISSLISQSIDKIIPLNFFKG